MYCEFRPKVCRLVSRAEEHVYVCTGCQGGGAHKGQGRMAFVAVCACNEALGDGM